MQPIIPRLKTAASRVASAGAIAEAEIAQLDLPYTPRHASSFGQAVVEAAKASGTATSKTLAVRQTQRARRKAHDITKAAHHEHAAVRKDLNALVQLCDYVETGDADGIPADLDPVIISSARIIRAGITSGAISKSIVDGWRSDIDYARGKLADDSDNLIKRWGPAARWKAGAAAQKRYDQLAAVTGDDTYKKLSDSFGDVLRKSVQRTRRERKAR